MPDAKSDIIRKLQKDILQWQGFAAPLVSKTKNAGLGPLEAAFPNGVFPAGAIHEMLCPTLVHKAASGGLLAGLIASLMDQGGACIWIATSRKLFPPSLKAFKLDPTQFIFVDVQQEKDVLWAMEEALKCEGLAAVVAEVKEVNFAQSRRLQLAVENSRVTGFLLRNDMKKLSTTACVARWQITPLPSELDDDMPGVGFPRWQVELLRVRNGNPGSWKLEWTNEGFVSLDDELKQKELFEIRQVG